MKQDGLKKSNYKIEELRTKAEALSQSSKLIKLCYESCFDERIHTKAITDSRAFLRSLNISIPDGLTLEFFNRPPRYLPFPEWTPFIIELNNCRTIWKMECEEIGGERKCLPKEHTVCFGFRIYPNLIEPIA